MVESRWSIATADGTKTIYGVLNQDSNRQNKKAILFIHGLTGDPYQFAQTSMAQQFPAQGYDVIRPYLYHGAQDARKLVDCTLALHACDVNTLYTHFKDHYDEIYAVGHSYGGPSIMFANANQFKAICLWDPTYDPSNRIFNMSSQLSQLGEYRMLTGSGTYRLMGEDMYQESAHIDIERSRTLARACTVPLKVILAGDSMWAKQGESFHTYAAGPSESVTIPDTIHCFYEEGTITPLLHHTKNWFDQF
jgi:pimeloyl-ACP methyl ester carboxylesterase